MHLDERKPHSTRTVILAVIGSLHFIFICVMLMDVTTHKHRYQIRTSQIIFIDSSDAPKLNKPNFIERSLQATITSKKIGVITPTRDIATSPNSTTSNKKIPIPTSQPEIHTETENIVINRDVKALTQNLEREWAQEERKQQAAKPPNQLVREYWEKQNHPYKDKWDALANKIEKAGVARGPQEESYTLDDGSRITKINGVCYKAPDPGRSYLAQPEVRQVFCPRN